jgi:transcriptional regulator with XRE-family HTH domain
LILDILVSKEITPLQKDIMKKTSFGILCQQYRIKKQITMTEMAKLIQSSSSRKVSQSYISKVESGKTPLTHSWINACTECFGLKRAEAYQLELEAYKSSNPIDYIAEDTNFFNHAEIAQILALAQALPRADENETHNKIIGLLNDLTKKVMGTKSDCQ